MGIVTENCSDKNQTESAFISFVISFLVFFFTTLGLVICLDNNHLKNRQDYTFTAPK